MESDFFDGQIINFIFLGTVKKQHKQNYGVKPSISEASGQLIGLYLGLYYFAAAPYFKVFCVFI